VTGRNLVPIEGGANKVEKRHVIFTVNCALSVPDRNSNKFEEKPLRAGRIGRKHDAEDHHAEADRGKVRGNLSVKWTN